MTTYTWRGTPDAATDYFTAAAWLVGGAPAPRAPGPGDTAILAFPGPNAPVFAVPGAARGDVVSGQTLAFIAAGTSRPLVAEFAGTALDGATTANFAGTSRVNVKGRTTWGGTVNIGSPTAAADVEAVLYGSDQASGYLAGLVNTGTVNITGASLLRLFPLTGATTDDQLAIPSESALYSAALLWRFEVRNSGTINVSGGSALVYSGLPGSSGRYFNTLVNDGSIRVLGTQGQSNALSLNAHVSGGGSIVLDGGNSTDGARTLLRTTGLVQGQTIVLNGGTWEARDNSGLVRVGTYDAQGNFISGSVKAVLQNGRNVLHVAPNLDLNPQSALTPDLARPFGATIYGFSAGDQLVVDVRELVVNPQTGQLLDRMVWDRANHVLTLVQPAYSPAPGLVNPERVLARFQLAGDYDASDFRLGSVTVSPLDQRVIIGTVNTRNNGANPEVAFAPGQRVLRDAPGDQRYFGDGTPGVLLVNEGARGARIAALPGGELAFLHAGQTDVLRGSPAPELRFIDGRLVLDSNDPAAQVARLYQAALGRQPDTGGLSYWAGQIARGTPLADLAQGFLNSAEFQTRFGANPSDAQFVAGLYRNVLGREPDAGGQAYWTGLLGQGTGRAAVLVGLSESAENRQATAGLVSGGLWVPDQGAAQVARLYDTVFGRLPDAGGLGYWAGQIASGAIDLQGVADRFVGAAEFQARYGALSDRDYVAAVYGNTLRRAPDAGGSDYWTARLGAGQSRAAVAVGFSESAEHQQLTAASVLGNTPGQWGVATA